MKKYILPLTLALAASVTVSAKTKLDSQAQAYVDLYKQMQLNPSASLATPVLMPFELNPKSRTAPNASVFVTLADGVSAADIEAQGLTVLSQAGNMVVANGSVDDIIALGETDLAKNISFGSKAEPQLKTARSMIGQDAIHQGTDGLKQGYDGTGVLCGVYDLGFDASHPNWNTADQSASRLAYVWRFGSYTGSCTEFTPDNMSSYTPDTESESHGTHTVGCMVGAHQEMSSKDNVYAEYLDGQVKVHNRFNKATNPYYGMAPGGTILVGAGQLYDANTTVALSKMVDYSKQQNMPLVISLSIGTTSGSHDEYDSFAQYLDNIADDAIICIAAGNDGESKLAIVKDLTSSDNQVKTFVDMSGSVTGYFEVYSKDATKFTLTPIIYDYVTDKIVYQYDVTANTVISTDSGDGYLTPSDFQKAFQSSYLNCIVDAHENTSKRYSVRVAYKLAYNSTSNSRKTKVLGFIVKGSAGQRIYFTKYGDATFTTNDFADCDEATSDFTISSMACGKKTIVVGAHNSQTHVALVSGGGYYYQGSEWDPGKIATFTSYGELYDGRKLPHICAPGTNIVSSVNSYDTDNYAESTSTAYVTLNGKKYYWAPMDGTSMATPIVAGAIATWVQAYPQLTYDEALKVIQETATVDELVTSSGNECQWGAGRFNAIAGLQKILGLGGVKNIVADIKDVVVSNNGNVFQAFVAGADKVNAQLYNISGQLVATATANDDKVDLDASHLTKGIYILKVNNNYSQRVVLN